ncbi:MAG: serine protein kinase, partial [bacterium]
MGQFDVNSFIRDNQNVDEYKEFTWEGPFQDYIDMVTKKPQITRNAFQRMYDMVTSHGFEEYVEFKKNILRYNFFKDEVHNGADAIFGLEVSLMKLVDMFKAAAKGYGPEKRVLLLHGPVGSAKSTIARLLKEGIEDYSKTEAGALYTFKWTDPNPPAGQEKLLGGEKFLKCPIHEEPLKLIPEDLRPKFLSEINKGKKDGYRVAITGDLCPSCRYIYSQLMNRYNGDWTKVMDHVVIKRLILSEKDRIGIGTFQPKDEKNQDSTELTGDVNYRKIAIFGSDSDPRAFNFDGEFNIANRGMIEFIEVLKLDVAFLYDLLGASQEHKIKPKKFSQTDIDLVILGHTNEPEYKKLQSNEYMEALRDRTLKIDIPY